MEDFLKDYGELFEANGKSYRKFLEAVTDVIANVALYITIALIAALVVWAIAVRNKDEGYLSKTRRTMLGIVVGYAFGIITVLGSLRLYAENMAAHITWHIWLVVGLFALVAIGIAVTLVLQKKQIKAYKWVALGFAVAGLAYVIVLLCVVKPTEADYAPQQSWLMYVLAAVLVAAIAVLAMLGGKSTPYNTKSITYAAICVAASFALSYVKFFSLPQGGSVTFASLFPLALYSYMFGTRKGVIAGVVYGLLQFMQSPQFYEPMQFLLDYPIAFACIGVAGIGRKFKLFKGISQLEFAFGALIGGILRYAAHFMSGYFVFYTYAAWGGYDSALVYSLAYNSFTMVDIAIVVIVGVLALSARSLRRIVLSAGVCELPLNEELQHTPQEQSVGETNGK
ncbi:MAG: energy-coupled thiamine transporter ThiT [Corallococcus sp.]|nr:energy-coupled thiamine transporter ThiT [Corallococcus sp.]MCM1359405.1 energy-coupled thiamine transporter ThiT [Corallococcus sp.]MCM1394848.1 energy-coupled thiamine transporter ThiT [Corallococcus sp.]